MMVSTILQRAQIFQARVEPELSMFGFSPSLTYWQTSLLRAMALVLLLLHKVKCKEQTNSQFEAFEPIPSLVKKLGRAFKK